MSQAQLAELSRVLYSPTTLALYLGASFVYLYALTTTVGRRQEQARGRRAQVLGGVLAVLGIGTHLAHEIVRGLAQGRFPLGNMFEVTSLMALVGVVGGLVYLQYVRRRPELNGFVLLGGALLLALALLMYAEPGPLQPILDTWWRHFHVSLLVGAMGIFAAGFVFNALYLLRDTAERSVAASRAATTRGSTVGAAYIEDVEDVRDVRDQADMSDTDDAEVAAAHAPTGAARAEGDDPDEELERAHAAAYRSALRAGVPAVKLAVGTFLGTASVSWVWLVSADTAAAGWQRFMTVNLVMVAAALLARWFVPFLPSTATLDGLAHRTIAFAFVAWTVGVIAGAMWAEQSWGRFWGWDPKETGSFLTWLAYAGYLHARATHGIKGRRAAWIGIGAFVVLMATYLVANYVIVGLHSYAEL
jgi:ABC-type transport system involved in cytochrome c biogenesis permease subunit